jgi:hypothetical protein
MISPLLAGLQLDDTFVLAWDRSADALTFFVLASLLPGHPEYSPPAEGEWSCYRAGLIQFRGVTSVVDLRAQASVAPTTDAAGALDYGCIDHLSMTEPGKYRFCGEFGTVSVAAEQVVVILAPPPDRPGEPRLPDVEENCTR